MLEKEVVKSGRRSAAENRAAVLRAGERKRRNRRERGQPTREQMLAWMKPKPAPAPVRESNPRDEDRYGYGSYRSSYYR